MSAKSTADDLPAGEILPLEKDPDTKAIIDKLMTGKPLEPDTERRIRAEGERARKEYEKRNGITDIAAELIREARNAE
jgi:hypothetical protein